MAKQGGIPQTNFAHLEAHDPQLVRLGMLAEKYFAEDPNTCLIKQRQFAELLAQMVAARMGVYTEPNETQVDLLRRLQNANILAREVADLFHAVRRTGNEANHALRGDHATALVSLKISWQLGLWFHRTFGDPKFKSGPFVPPAPPKDESAELRAELESLGKALADYQAVNSDALQRLAAAEAQLKAARDDQSFWEQMAVEAEQAKLALQQRLAEQQAAAAQQAQPVIEQLRQSANTAAQQVELTEADTRRLIDAQLRAAGWQVDSVALTHAKGARPLKNVNRAIAEWPTGTGPADYVLFIGLRPVAVVEAKRKNIDVSAALKQAERYSRGFIPGMAGDDPTSGTWGDFKVPFAFSSNGRPYLRQLETRSGTWFRDLRRPTNLGRALDGWYSPEGLNDLLKQDAVQAHAQLVQEPFDYGFALRPYQIEAIRAVEGAVGDGRRSMLVAMATGTGKTKTCIALIYRLLKAKRFKRVLFLVDRSALGIQAADAFKDTRMESLQTFADTFGIKELADQKPDSDTAVHIATVQGMVKRVLNPSDEAVPLVDQYDCIVVDECHRGYLLDRELSETEFTFRGFDDYVSKYRRVLEYFDAVKIGLTATPALHTTQIFGEPVYAYGYREAVIDGYLVDYEPPYQIQTELSQNGISWQPGEEVKTYDAASGQLTLFNTPDEIHFDVESFNRRVITESFNQVVCEALAEEIDPASPHKTLIFCANDAHADMVVTLLKAAFEKRYGAVEDDSVIKITGNADQPLQLIRRFKNERNPNVAVTVDLLTTGIDVPAICNLVFLRRVNSRILFDQMIGRATRLCPAIGKEAFRVFDAVRLYETMQHFSDMRPVVVDPKIGFTQLATELAGTHSDAARELAREQFVAKLQRKKRTLSESATRDFETRAGMSPDAFIAKLKDMPLNEVGDWFTRNPDLGEILDRKGDGPRAPLFVSDKPDALRGITRGYGDAAKPEDYIAGFAKFVQTQKDAIPALVTVLTRPRELTRKQLRELALTLDAAGYNEASLASAWRAQTNQDIAARIVGFVRAAAMQERLLPYEQRVDQALQRILASRSWTRPQQDWLKRIAEQTKANIVVDREAFDDADLLFKRDGGGFARLDRVFDGQLMNVVNALNDGIWQ